MRAPIRRERRGMVRSADFSQMRLEFAERLLDWIEVRRIFGEVTQSRTGRFNQFSHTGNLG